MSDGMKLSNVAVLASLNISQWTARKYDKKVSKEIADTHGVHDFVGRYNKALLPMTDELNKITNLGQQMRHVFYQNTLPYAYEGVRLIPSKNYFEFMKLMNNYVGLFNDACETFYSNYKDNIEGAKDVLGELYRDSDYPDEREIRGRFGVSLTIHPVPEADTFFDVLAEDMAKAAFDDYVECESDTARKAMRDCWDRLSTLR